MKNMFGKSVTRYISLLLSVLIIFSLILCSATAATAYEAGTEVKVTFLMPETDYVTGVEGDVTYGDTLEYVADSLTKPNIPDATVNTAKDGVISFNATNIGNYDMTVDNVLFTVNFKLLADADTVDVTCVVTDAYYLDDSYDFVDVSTLVEMQVVKVSAESTEPSTGVTEPSTGEPKPTETEATEPSTNVPDPTESTQPSETTGTTPTESTKPTEPSPEPTENKKPATPNVGPGADAGAAGNAIINQKGDEDPQGSSFGILSARQKKVKTNSIQITWNKVSGATKYDVYGAKCGSSYKKIKTIKKVKFTQKKLNKGTYYKYLVMAIDKNNKVISTSKTLHIATAGSKKKANPTGVKTAAQKDQVSIKVKKKFNLKGANVVAKKTKVKKHRTIKYETSNASVATVTSKGKITGKKTGSCYVYAYAQNGLYKKIKVTVKK